MKKILVRVLISGGFLGLLFYLMREDIPVIGSALREADKPMIAVAIPLFLSTVVILAWRLQLIFRVGHVPIKLVEASNLTFVGYFFNNFLPTSVGGDIVKAMSAARITGHTVKSVTSVLMDRIFGLFTFVLIPSLSLLFLKDTLNPVVPVLVYSFLGVSVFCFLMLFNRGLARRFHFVELVLNRLGIGKKAREIYDGLHNFKHHKGVIAGAMLLSLVGQGISIFVTYLLALSLGAKPDTWIYFYLLVPVVNLVSMLPSLNGLGIREGAYIYFLKAYIGAHLAAALSIVWLGLLFFLSLIGGIIYFVRHDYHIRFKETAAS